MGARRQNRLRQLELPGQNGWGGPREGAGRPPLPRRRPPVPHRRRAEHRQRFPVHVTLRAHEGLPSLRRFGIFAHITRAIAASEKPWFRVVQFSVQSNHVHAIVEANDTSTLSSGLRSLVIRIALAVNRSLGRKGPVWADRFHTHELRSPRETRNGLLYVLQNWKKHEHDARGIDDRSSGPWFGGWNKGPTPPEAVSPVSPPRTWLASRGWRERGGGPLHPNDGPARPRRAPSS
jgi:REP element-mobilizing transposase RayT